VALSHAKTPRGRIRAESCRRMRFCCLGMALREQPRAKKPGIWCRAFRCPREGFARCAAQYDQNGQPSVHFQLTGEGGQRFYNFTSAHVGERLGVILDNRVQEVANIKEAIRTTPGENQRWRQHEPATKPRISP